MRLMFGARFRFAAAVAAVLLSFSSQTFAAEVYYLGAQPADSSGAPGSAKAPAYPHYSLEKRAKDLLDFRAFGDNSKDRSGRIGGSILQEIDANDVVGNKEKSFLTRGAVYLTEVNLNAYEKLWRDYKFEGQAMIRKTDDPRIELRRDLRLKQLDLRIDNGTNLLQFGNFYGELSQFTMGSMLEGFNVEAKPHRDVRLKTVAARRYGPDVVALRYQRNVFGGKVDFTPFSQSGPFSLFRIGAQAVTNQDDRDKEINTNLTTDISNTVFGIDGEMVLKKFLSVLYELARSSYTDNVDYRSDRFDDLHGTAFKVQPGINFWNKASFKYLHYYVQPDFYTDAGSAQADKIQHQFSFDLTPIRQFRLSLVENFYWDHMGGSARSYRTYNNEKYITSYIRPWNSRTSFYLRPYINFLSRYSEDIGDSLKAKTVTSGFSVNDTIQGMNLGARYEYRGFLDQSTKSGSDYFHRFGGNLSRDLQLFKRRLYLSTDFNFDTRDSKSMTKDDVSIGVSANGQYDLHSRATFRFGYNVMNMDSGMPVSGYINNRTFLELDLLAHRKRSSHVISRLERNVFNHDDGSQDYREFRAITKFTSQF